MINTPDFPPPLGDFDVGTLEGLRAFPGLQEVAFYLDTGLPNEVRPRLLEEMKARLEDHVKGVVFGVKIVFKRGYHDFTKDSWPFRRLGLPYSRSEDFIGDC